MRLSELTPERRKEIERDTEATIGYTSATSAEPSWTMLENSPSGHKRKLAAHIRLLLHILASTEQSIVRLTTERDEWKQKAEIKMSEREALTTFFHEGQRLEIGQLRADIAAARAALLDIQRTVHKHVADRIAEETLARLGTGKKTP